MTWTARPPSTTTPCTSAQVRLLLPQRLCKPSAVCPLFPCCRELTPRAPLAAERDGRQLRDADGNFDAMLQAQAAALSLAEKFGLGVGRSIKPRLEHDPWKDRFWGRHEPFAEAFEGVSYDPADPRQVAVVTGALSPPSFDPDEPAANAPPGGWPLLLLLPSGGSLTRTDETDESALDVFAARDVAAQLGMHVLTIAFPRMRNGWAVDSAAVKHESFIVRVLVPYLRKAYGAGPISLLGVGSGGFGAVSLLLRHPTVFFRAAAFDAPLMREGFKDLDTQLNDPGQEASFAHDLEHFRSYHSLFHMAIDPRVMSMLGGPHEAVLRAAQTPLFDADADGYVGLQLQKFREEQRKAQAAEAAAAGGAAAQAESEEADEEAADDDEEVDEDGNPLIDNPYYDFFQRYMAQRPPGPGALAPEQPVEEEEELNITEKQAREDPVLAELVRVRAAKAAKRAHDEEAARLFHEAREHENEELDRIRAEAQASGIPRIAVVPSGEMAQGQKANYASTMMFAHALSIFGIPHVCAQIPEPPILRSWLSADSWLPGVLSFIATGAGAPYSPATHTAPSAEEKMTHMREKVGHSYAADQFAPLLLRRDRLELDAELWDPVRPEGEAAAKREAEIERDVTGSRVAFLYMKLQAMLTPRRPRRQRRPKAVEPGARMVRRRRKGVEDADGEEPPPEEVKEAKKRRPSRAKQDITSERYPWVRKNRRHYLKPFRARKPRNLEEQLKLTRRRKNIGTFTFLETRKAKLMLRFRHYTWNMSTAELCELGHRLIERICIVLDGTAFIAAKRGDPEYRARATIAAEMELKMLGDEAEVARIVEQAKKEGRPARVVALEEMASRARARMQQMGLRGRWDTDAPQTWEDNDPALRAGRAMLKDRAEVQRIKEQAAREGRPPQQVALEEIAKRALETQRRLAAEEAMELAGGDEDEADEDEMSEEDMAEMAEIEAMELQEMMQNGDPLLADLEKEFGVRRRGSKTREWSSDSDMDASDMEALLGDDEELDEDTDTDLDFDSPGVIEDEPPPPPKKRGGRR